jgi:hypothetical protein
MLPDEWAKWFRDKYPNEPIDELVNALRIASKFGFWHSPEYAESVIHHLKKLE